MLFTLSLINIQSLYPQFSWDTGQPEFTLKGREEQTNYSLVVGAVSLFFFFYPLPVPCCNITSYIIYILRELSSSFLFHYAKKIYY